MNYNELRLKELNIEILEHKQQIEKLTHERNTILKEILTVDKEYIQELDPI